MRIQFNEGFICSDRNFGAGEDAGLKLQTLCHHVNEGAACKMAVVLLMICSRAQHAANYGVFAVESWAPLDRYLCDARTGSSLPDGPVAN